VNGAVSSRHQLYLAYGSADADQTAMLEFVNLLVSFEVWHPFRPIMSQLKCSQSIQMTYCRASLPVVMFRNA
jgi:hypothetical protein